MKKIETLGVVAISVLLSFNTWAADLFVDGKIRAIQSGDSITAADTIGGYAIYQGEGGWKFEKAVETSSSGGRVDSPPAPIGVVGMSQWINGTLFAYQLIHATLRQAGGSYWSGSPCAPGHLVAVNKPRGREDHCMTIDPVSFTASGKKEILLSIKLTNTKGGQALVSELLVNPRLLGVIAPTMGDWTMEAVQSQPYKKEFIEKLTVWGEKLLERAMKSFDYSQPQDVYADMPSLRTLVPESATYPSSQFSLAFLSALADIKHKKDFKAMAYSIQTESRTPHGSAWGQSTQAEANKKALDYCEQIRGQSALPCKLINLADM